MAYAMVAIRAGGPEVFEKREFEPRPPGPGEALVRHTAIGINFIDVYQRTGLYPVASGMPATLGLEAAGVVEAIGANVSQVSEGDRVAFTGAPGCYATHNTLIADKLVRLPDEISDAEAAGCMLKGLTAQYLIFSSYPVKSGETVLFHAAAGGVGLIAGQWLSALGVQTIGTAGSPEKVQLALDNGYAHCINYSEDFFVDRVMELTDGAGVPAVYDSVGKSTYPGSLQVLQKFGTFVSFGQSSGMIEDFKLGDLSANGSLYAIRPTLFHYIDTREELEKRSAMLFDVMAAGKVKIAVNQTFALEDVADAHRTLESRQTTGQTVLLP